MLQGVVLPSPVRDVVVVVVVVVECLGRCAPCRLAAGQVHGLTRCFVVTRYCAISQRPRHCMETKPHSTAWPKLNPQRQSPGKRWDDEPFPSWSSKTIRAMVAHISIPHNSLDPCKVQWGESWKLRHDYRTIHPDHMLGLRGGGANNRQRTAGSRVASSSDSM